MSERLGVLTAQQILESYDLAENESSDDELDSIEKRIETTEDEANSSTDDCKFKFQRSHQ